MKPTVSRLIQANLQAIHKSISSAHKKYLLSHSYAPYPLLVAVSKTKPPSIIIEAYRTGHRNFGENYIQELIEKSNYPDILSECPDINWHFIGHLQRSNVNKITKVHNLWIIESVDSEKLATALNLLWKKESKTSKLNVMVQVKMSNEESKYGCSPSECIDLVKYVTTQCDQLEFKGLMTIGPLGHEVTVSGPNPGFLQLIECKKKICEEIGLADNTVELSMGMSSDYDHAISLGSTSIRVGTAIFGERNYSKERKD